MVTHQGLFNYRLILMLINTSFIHQLYKCSHEVNVSAYMSLVCPFMEYASICIVWDPYQINYINSLQHRVARWATSKYSRFNGVSNIPQSLTWLTLELHCKIAGLRFFTKLIPVATYSFLFQCYKQAYSSVPSFTHDYSLYSDISIPIKAAFFHELSKIGMPYHYTELKLVIMIYFTQN